jgi:hypothetical protein
MIRQWTAIALAGLVCGCSRTPETPRPRNLLLITIDTLRADRVGAYGYARARTPRLDALAAAGVRFERAYAAAPITLPSHATILSGRYPPGHGARDNGMKVSDKTPTLATELKARGFRTAAFVAAFPLDHQFGLARGFDVYSDRLPRDRAGRQANERPATDVVNEAIAWLGGASARGTQAPGTPAPRTPAPAPPAPAPDTLHQHPAPSTQHSAPFFLWLHFFEPHAPYEGDLSRPVADRYDDEIATVDRAVGRMVDALGDRKSDTLIIATADHGEAFGEHGEHAHSIFVYDTTLRVPLILVGPGLAPKRIAAPITLADIAPTAMKLLGFDLQDVDGVDLSRALSGEPLSARELYAESFAPLVEFGWAPLAVSVRAIGSTLPHQNPSSSTRRATLPNNRTCSLKDPKWRGAWTRASIDTPATRWLERHRPATKPLNVCARSAIARGRQAATPNPRCAMIPRTAGHWQAASRRSRQASFREQRWWRRLKRSSETTRETVRRICVSATRVFKPATVRERNRNSTPPLRPAFRRLTRISGWRAAWVRAATFPGRSAR